MAINRNDILPFGFAADISTGATLTLADYAADADRPRGNQLGLARRELVNTAMRQNSLISNGIAQFIANRYANGVADTNGTGVTDPSGYINDIETGLVEGIKQEVNTNVFVNQINAKASSAIQGATVGGVAITPTNNILPIPVIAGPSGPQGLQGLPGTPGATGAPGATWLTTNNPVNIGSNVQMDASTIQTYGTNPPPPKVGDFVISHAPTTPGAYGVILGISGTTVTVTGVQSIRGPTGATGPTGPAGQGQDLWMNRIVANQTSIGGNRCDFVYLSPTNLQATSIRSFNALYYAYINSKSFPMMCSGQYFGNTNASNYGTCFLWWMDADVMNGDYFIEFQYTTGNGQSLTGYVHSDNSGYHTFNVSSTRVAPASGV